MSRASKAYSMGQEEDGVHSLTVPPMQSELAATAPSDSPDAVRAIAFVPQVLRGNLPLEKLKF